MRAIEAHCITHMFTGEVTVAERLKAKRYATASIGKWHLCGKEHEPEHQGFDMNLGGTAKGQPPSYFSSYRIAALPDGAEGEYLTDREAAEAVAFIESHRDRPRSAQARVRPTRWASADTRPLARRRRRPDADADPARDQPQGE